MTEPADIRKALEAVIDPVTGRDIVSTGLVSGIVVRQAKAGFLLTIASETQAARQGLVEAARRRVLAAFPELDDVTPVLTGEAAPAAPPRREAQWNKEPLPHVKRLLAVASGKGGVGKSSVAVGLAHAFGRLGLAVGLLDADIHGPSIPRMLGAYGKPELEGGKLVPLQSHGIAMISTGLLIEEGHAAVMRGPMVAKTLQQFLRGTAWGTAENSLDLLILDLPPGTGDVQLSLAQNVPLGAPGGGALIVTTPAAVALADARKAADMFQKIGVPILGIVENMSWLETAGGGRTLLFGEGGGQALSTETGAPLLAQLSLDPALGAALDRGELPPLEGFLRIAQALQAQWGAEG